MHSMKRIIKLAALPLVLCGCGGVKNLQKSDIAMPASYSELMSAPDDTLSIADIRWYEFYSDTTLCNLIERALENNKDFLKAASRVEEARALYGIDKARWYPVITGIVSGDNETTDYNGAGVKSGQEYSLKLSLNWEVNLWGAVSWAKRKGMSNYLATVEEMRAMQMSLVAELAEAYFRLVALDNELIIVNETLRTRSEALEQARLRFEGGLTPETVYQQAVVEYATTASLIPNLEREFNVARNAITLLMGEFPKEDLQRGALYINVMLPEKVPSGIPSSLLQRRPDIRAAEQRMASAMANVGLTYANRFPNFKINLTGGFENEQLTDFLKSPYSYVIGSIAGTIFDFGKKKKQYEAAIAEYDQARYTYEQTVIEAFTEVNNALTAYQKYQETYGLKLSLREAALKYVNLAHLQYRAGSLNYLDVLDAQRKYFDAQISLSNALRDEYIALVNLYKALGGGWQLPSI